MESEYPIPCEKCRMANNGDCSKYRTCASWLTWFRWWWHRFRREYGTPIHRVERIDGFCYAPPGEDRQARKKPCDICVLNADCDTPCAAYLSWYNAKLQGVRERLGLI